MVTSNALLLPVLALAGHFGFTLATPFARADATAACKDIETAIGASNVFYPGMSPAMFSIRDIEC